MPDIELVDATTTDGHGRPRLRGVSLQIQDGEVVVLLGDDASGALDVARAVLGVQRLTRGRVRIGRHDVGAGARARAEADPPLDEAARAWDHIAQPLRKRNLSRREVERRVLETAKALGIADILQARVRTLGADQRRWLKLARAVVRQPAVLLPEVFAGLAEDAEDAEAPVPDVLRAIRALGLTTVLVQDALQAVPPADRVAVFEAGRLRQQGAPGVVYERPVDLYTAARWGRHSLALTSAARSGRRLVSDLGSLELPSSVMNRLGDRPLVMGVRPEGIRAPGVGSGRDLPVRGHVSGVRAAGTSGIADVTLALAPGSGRGVEAAGLDPGRVDRVRIGRTAKPGEPVVLGVDPDRLLLFDADTGENLLGQDALGDLGKPVSVRVREEPGGPPWNQRGRTPGRPPEPAPTVRRFLQCAYPQSVRMDSRFSVTVSITVEAPGGKGAPFQMPAIPPGGVELFVALHADPGFTAVIDAFFTLPVPQEGDSEEKWFILTAPAQPGRYGLVVTVVGGNVPLIEQPLTIEVTDKATAPIGDPLLTVLPDTQPEPGSTLLLVTRHSPRAYDFHVGRGENYTPLTRPRRYTFDPTTRLRRLSRELSAMAAGGRISEMAIDMANKGIQLWNDFVPEDIGDYLTGLDIGTETLRVRAHGDGDLVPWEMLHPPVVTKDSPGFLASLFPTVRLPPMEGQRLTSRLRLDRAQFVVPGGNLEDAAEEAAAIRRILGIEDGQSPSIREKAKLLHVLRDGGFGMLHIASHNRHGGEAALEMDLKQRFEPESLNEFIVGGPAWAEDAPLVFLNACGTDQPHRTFTSFSTWAGKFFHAGAGAFVGSMWDIRSDSARVFAERFYEALVQERQSMAQAAYRARQRTRETTRDPTWLAYAVHGHHLATVVDQPPRP